MQSISISISTEHRAKESVGRSGRRRLRKITRCLRNSQCLRSWKISLKKRKLKNQTLGMNWVRAKRSVKQCARTRRSSDISGHNSGPSMRNWRQRRPRSTLSERHSRTTRCRSTPLIRLWRYGTTQITKQLIKRCYRSQGRTTYPLEKTLMTGKKAMTWIRLTQARTGTQSMKVVTVALNTARKITSRTS